MEDVGEVVAVGAEEDFGVCGGWWCVSRSAVLWGMRRRLSHRK